MLPPRFRPFGPYMDFGPPGLIWISTFKALFGFQAPRSSIEFICPNFIKFLPFKPYVEFGRLGLIRISAELSLTCYFDYLDLLLIVVT